MKKVIFILLAFILSLGLQAQVVEPVHWSKVCEGDSMRITATINEGWHMTLISINDSIIGEEYTGIYNYTIHHPLSTIHTIRYNACDDHMCTAPETYIVEPSTIHNSPSDAPSTIHHPQSTKSLWVIFLLGLLGGLMAIFTPCVWPIIPMTVSFFLKQQSFSPKGGLSAQRSFRAMPGLSSAAGLYGLSIVIIYVGLGLLITVLFGASALNALSTNAIVNLFFFALLVVFALSFFGLFEITLPSSWSTKIDNKARSTTGFLSILLMAFTLVIVSFSCTGPIIGTLLVEAAGRSLLAPAVGMLGFAIALALPFSIFALFPSWMQNLPKSGEWMTSFKVCLAFAELALSLKFLSVADLAYGWGILPRWLFFILWTACFLGMGIYLFIHLRNSSSVAGKITAAVIGIASILFSVYSAQGIFGRPVAAVAAFAPPMEVEGQSVFTDYETGLRYAQQENKLILLDFSGYGCVNCRKMEANVLSVPEVQELMQEYVFITLYVDSRQDENGNGVEDGVEYSRLQRERFESNAQPYWVRLTSREEMIGKPLGFTSSPAEFIQWLNDY